MNKKRLQRNNLKHKYFIIIIMFIIFLLSLFCMYISSKNINLQDDKFLYSNSINKDIEYKVNLMENNYINKSYLEEDKTYISELVKSIDTKFKYDFRTSKKMNFEYTYNIIATIKGEYQGANKEETNNVWEKDYVLLKDTKKTLNDSVGFNISNEQSIDFAKYNAEVTEFRKKLKLSINAYVNVSMNVKVYSIDENSNKRLEDESSVDMTIPLNKQAFSITKNYQATNTNSVYDENKDAQNTTDINNINFTYIAILLFLLDIIIFILNFRKLIDSNYIHSKYRMELKKILKNYGDIIVEIVNPVKAKLSGVIDVKNFNEMIDLEEELRTPILFYEIPGRNEGWFTIIHEEILYRYVLKDSNNDNTKNNEKRRR